MKQTILALCLVIALSSVARGFNEFGHSLIAKIAYERLTPAQRDKVYGILQHHPHFAEYLQAEKPADVSEQEWAIIRAATWADWVRTHHRAEFHESEWHYINYPYQMGWPTEALPEVLPQNHSILERLPLAIKMARGATTNDLELPEELTQEERQAVAMTWMFHLIGDLQQPLHVVAMVNEPRWPAANHGDQGGNGVAVLIEGTKPMRLHSYWDGVLGIRMSYAHVVAEYSNLTENPPIAASELAPLLDQNDFQVWALEGYRLAAKYCYLDGNLQLAPWAESYNTGGSAEPGVPTLSAAVQEDAKKIYRQRIFLAGERLATQLKLMFP
jgi:hypothetical protein